MEATESGYPTEASAASIDASADHSVSDSTEEPTSRVDMNAVMRAALEMPEASTAADDDDDDQGADASGDSASDGVNPSQGTRLSRRGAAARIEHLNGEVARLSALVSQLAPPPQPSADEARRTQSLQDEQRFQQLARLPDDDATLLQGDNWVWLQDQKRRRALLPEVTDHYEAVLADERARRDSLVQQQTGAVLADLRSQLAAADSLGGLTDADKKTLRETTSWLDHVRLHRAAERKLTQQEGADQLTRLRKENEQLRLELTQRARAPLDGGRATGGSGRVDMNDRMRAALGIVAHS